MRVAFTLIGGGNWTGGQRYLINLLKALIRHEHERVTPILFVSAQHNAEDISAFADLTGLTIVQSALLDPSRRHISLFQALFLGQDTAIRWLFAAHGIDLVFENAQFWGWRLGLPAIAWIPDFQHRLLPQMFPAMARWKRELGFHAQISGRRLIMLSSDDARRACEDFYPATRGRTRTVHFAVPQEPLPDANECRRIADGYGLPDSYFFMPNQFWRHKNHILVAEALAILKEQGQRIVVAAAGRQMDPRDPGHFARLQSRLEELGVQHELLLLGLIPYVHMLALMRVGTALLNPSLFEGWSTTVEEARSMAIPMLLSDLDVHREQMGEAATYFDRFSPYALAETLAGFATPDWPLRESRFAEARQEAEQRVGRFAARFAELAESACQRNGR